MRFSKLGRAALVGAMVVSAAVAVTPPAQASGTGSIAGRLTTSDGTGAADHLVEVYTDEGSYLGWTTTDADGNYSFGGLTDGSYVVGFPLPGGPTQYHRQKSRFWDADLVNVVDGEVTRVDEQLLPTGTITGRIVDTAGNAVPDLLVQAVEIDSWQFSFGRTDEDGRYRIPVLEGRYVVSFEPIEGLYQSQYIPQQIDESSATVFEVTAGAEVVADDTLLPTGSLSGRFTDETGQPLVNAEVQIYTAQGGYVGVYPSTDANGEFTVPTILVGSYKLRFSTADWSRSQYYRGKLYVEDADPVTVQAGQGTWITDSLLPTGSVLFRAVDAVTGEQILDFCVSGAESGVCSDGTGEALYTDLTEGPHTFLVYTDSGTHLSTELTLEVQPETTIEATVELEPAARITTTVVDRQTGAPVPGVCIIPFSPRKAILPDSRAYCSDSDGRITIGRLAAGSYQLFVDTTQTSYGMQWVGEDGGTGDQRKAVTVVATPGTTVAAPQVKLDPAGAIAGRVTDAATGAGLSDVIVSPLSFHPGVGPSLNVWTDEEGRYEFAGFGPYEWPLLFKRHGYPAHWSGGTGNRHQATKIRVMAGDTVTHDEALTAGTEVTGTFTNQDGVSADYGYVLAHNAVTGDIVGVSWFENGRYSMPVLGRQRIYFSYDVSFGEDYYSGTFPTPRSMSTGGPRHTKVFRVPPTGSLTVNIVIQTD
jgi:5-hydroxyisourate hydrolase-like protein (transthyretin family)